MARKDYSSLYVGIEYAIFKYISRGTTYAHQGDRRSFGMFFVLYFERGGLKVVSTELSGSERNQPYSIFF